MKTNYILLAIVIILLAACKKSEDSIPKETKAVINGETFKPTTSEAKKLRNKLVISFESGTKKIEITTNDTISGTYSIVSQSLKSVSALKANIKYTDGSSTYLGTSGEMEITDNKTDAISGTYNATVVNGSASIEINSGSFANISLKSESLIETEAAINDSLQLCYSKFQEYIELTYIFDAVYSNSIPAPNSSWSEIYNHSQTTSSNNEKIFKLWSDAYDIIYKTNLIIKSAEIVIVDKETQDKIIAQATAIRAYLYYVLMTWFGEIPLEQGISQSMIPRNKITEVLSKIQSDATEACLSLPVTWASSDKFRIPLCFAKGLLARVYLTDFGPLNVYPPPKPYLYSSNYSEAINIAQQITNTGIYALQSTPDNFPASGTEIIWGFEKGSNTEFNQIFTKGTYVPVMRLTEIYLILSEALYQNGNMPDVLSLINQLNSRRGNSINTSLTPQDIYVHWNTELKLEGSIFLVQKRFLKAFDVVQKDMVKFLLPIPLPVIMRNVNLTQNVGYD